MNFRKEKLLYRLLIMIITIGAFAGASYAQFTVTLSGPSPSATPNPSPTATPAPTGSFTVSAAITGNSNSITKVVFYRNDVPYETDTTSTYSISQDQLGQDTYVYRARAYDSTGVWVDSGEFKLTVKTPRVVKMGEVIGGTQTYGPRRDIDHTPGIQAAMTYLNGQGGGTLVFPCFLPYFPPPYQATRDGIAVYNIRETIDIPSNVTLQGESSEEGGKCRIYWNDVSWGGGPPEDPCQVNDDEKNDYPLNHRPMFRINGGVHGVRFRDLWLYSRTSGPNCPYPRPDVENIENDDNTGIEMTSVSTSGNIKDIILENVSITNFTYGVKALSNSGDNDEITDIKIRAYRPAGNFRQLYIDAKYAYNWDIQNLNINGMAEDQAGVQIVTAGQAGRIYGRERETQIRLPQLQRQPGPRPSPGILRTGTEAWRTLFQAAASRRSAQSNRRAGHRCEY